MKGKQYNQKNHVHNYRLLKILVDNFNETICVFYCTRCLVYDVKVSDNSFKDLIKSYHKRLKGGIKKNDN